MQLKPETIDIRVQRRIAELEYYLYSYQTPVPNWQVSRDWPEHIAKPEAVDKILKMRSPVGSDTDTQGDVRMPFSAPAKDCQTYWLSTAVNIPEELRDMPTYLQLKTNAECLVYLDGQPWQGLDDNRSLVLLSDSADPETTYQVDIMLFTGRDRNGKSISAELVCPAMAVQDYRHDLRAVLGVARALPNDDATAIRLWHGLSASINAIEFHDAERPPSVDAALDILQGHLQALRNEGHGTANFDVFMVGNSHIDVTWLWTLAETRQKMGRTTSTALRYMDEMPDYRFAQSQPQIYEYLRQDFPTLFEQVQQRVAEDRWELVGAAWVEPDCNVTGGESLVRQILYGQKFWKEHFGRESNIFWLPDTFGYASALPQILVKSGLDTFMTQKLTWSETNKFPHAHFDWEGVDGTRIRCTFPQTYVSRTYPEEIIEYYRRNPSKDIVPSFFYLYGYGDGGGGPVREDVELGSRLDDMPGFPKCRFSSAKDALKSIKDEADTMAETSGQDIPVWKGELYLEFHRGTLTTHSRVKRNNRLCELRLRESEIWASLAAVRNGFEYPAADLEAAWKKVLLNQFHDIVPGTSIPPVYLDVHEMYEEVLDCTEDVIGSASSSVADPDTTSEGFTVMNSLAWPVVDWVEFDVPDGSDVYVEDTSGSAVPHQVIANSDGGTRIGLEATVPALGHTSYYIRRGSQSEATHLQAGDRHLENDRYNLRFNEKGQIESVYDKSLEREWLDGPANVLQTFDDRPNSWEAWDLNDWYREAPLDLLKLDSAEIVEQGPARVVMRLRHTSKNGSTIEQDVVLYRSIARIDFLTRVDWHEQRVLLKAAFPVAIHNTSATFDIQFGSIERPTHSNTSWDAAKFEVCAHKWSDLSEGNGGVSLLNDCKYGHDIKDNVMRISLLRNPTHPDARCPTPSYLFPNQESEVVFTDTGTHEMRYALYPHESDWRNGTVRQAYNFNSPLRVISGVSEPTSDCGVSDDGIVVETLKQAEDGNGFILRVFEAHGGRRRTSIRLPFAFADVEATDLMERPAAEEGEIEKVDDQTIEFFIKPYEIRTIRLQTK